MTTEYVEIIYNEPGTLYVYTQVICLQFDMLCHVNGLMRCNMLDCE